MVIYVLLDNLTTNTRSQSSRRLVNSQTNQLADDESLKNHGNAIPYL